jgi:hypothetical protein
MESRAEMETRHRKEREALEAEERAAALAAVQREREARAAEELHRNQQALEERIAAAAADPARMLNEIARDGVTLSVDDGDTILATPAGGLNLIFRRALERVRPTVITLLRQRQQVETI